MAGKAKRSVPVNLNGAEIMITNASTDEKIMTAVGMIGYGSERIAEGKTLLIDATAKKDTRVALSGAQLEATAASKAAMNAAKEAFQSYSVLVKGEFKGKKETLAVLGLDKPMPRTEASLIEAGKTLFANAASHPEIKSGMLKYGYDDAKLAAEQAKVLAFEKANDQQKAAEGAAQNATEDQTKSIARLNDWVAQFRKAAKIALKNNKQLLEKLGIHARSTKTKAQRGAPKKAAATRAAQRSTTK